MVITFSRNFQSTHPRKGEPTYFVEKIWQSIYMQHVGTIEFEACKCAGFDIGLHSVYKPKHHTIRTGNRFKVGDWFEPRIWTGRPYCSPQFQFAPKLEVKKVWKFEVDELGVISIDGKYYFPEEPLEQLYDYVELAGNDGLSAEDFANWIIQPAFKTHTRFIGQIICWNNEIEY